jgi:hypothetical protein
MGVFYHILDENGELPGRPGSINRRWVAIMDVDKRIGEPLADQSAVGSDKSAPPVWPQEFVNGHNRMHDRSVPLSGGQVSEAPGIRFMVRCEPDRIVHVRHHPFCSVASSVRVIFEQRRLPEN